MTATVTDLNILTEGSSDGDDIAVNHLQEDGQLWDRLGEHNDNTFPGKHSKRFQNAVERTMRREMDADLPYGTPLDEIIATGRGPLVWNEYHGYSRAATGSVQYGIVLSGIGLTRQSITYGLTSIDDE